MAICDDCDQEMLDPVSCTWMPTILIDADPKPEFAGTPFERIRYPIDTGLLPRCRDCGAPQGGLHHPGCCVERCPACDGQAISCDCRWEGDDYEDEDGCPAVLEMVAGMRMPCGQPEGHEPPHEHGTAGVPGVAYARWRDLPDGSWATELMQFP